MDPVSSSVTPQPTQSRHDTPYYRNVSISRRGQRLVVVDQAGAEHPYTVGSDSAELATADALVWLSVPSPAGPKGRLLLLDTAGSVLADLSGEGWDLAQVREFGEGVGVPLVEEDYPDQLAARGAYPVRAGALVLRPRTGWRVVLPFLPVLVPVLLVIIAALVLGH